jgi:hypothetical protein
VKQSVGIPATSIPFGGQDNRKTISKLWKMAAPQEESSPKAMETDVKLTSASAAQPRFEKYVVPMSMHAEIRTKLLQALAEALSMAGKEKRGIILLKVSV